MSRLIRRICEMQLPFEAKQYWHETSLVPNLTLRQPRNPYQLSLLDGRWICRIACI